MTPLVIGMDFRTAPVAIRERAALRAEEIPERLRRFRSLFPAGECVILSTCNRTEAYLAGPEVCAEAGRIAALLFEADDPSAGCDAARWQVRRGERAVEHLFAVASGLDSMVVGETEVLGQVRQALAIAVAAGTAASALRPLFQRAIRTAGRVHAETGICRGRVSVSSLAVELAETLFRDLSERTVMVVGAGETAERVLKSLVERGVRAVFVFNRSPGRVGSLVRRIGGRALPLDAIEERLPEADIVLCSTSAPHPVIRAGAVRRAAERRRDRPLLLIDLAVPRDIEPEAGEAPNVRLHDLDGLRRIAAVNLAGRRQVVQHAWRIVRDGVAETLDAPSVSRAREKPDDRARRRSRPCVARKGGWGVDAERGRCAILFVPPGTTCPEAGAVMARVDAAAARRFPGVERRWAFTSAMIRERLRARGTPVASPGEALAVLSRDGFHRVAVTPLHLVAGREYGELEQAVAERGAASGGGARLTLGTAMLSRAADVRRVLEAALSSLPEAPGPEEAVILAAHGSPLPRGAADFASAAALARSVDRRLLLGVGIGSPDIRAVVRECVASGFRGAWLLPFMVWAGHTARQAVAGDGACSWKAGLERNGVGCRPLLRGLGTLDETVSIWLDQAAALLECGRGPWAGE